ncbi:hypothetical protein EGW08_022867 [Elysia chlorotica]|uniref:CWH43-like N-terminal domain-containing protein n=1 Tax=Elysia chlorotica TaxID=188477 RepID=A0A433SJT5_ELYCH|nr:hypothetical protein EGW08_022867 [Elysia chlorotica]
MPVFTAIFIISSFFVAYGISVYHGHVEPDFPYISYAAIQAPERCVFAQLINVGALLLAANIYIRYLQMSKVLDLLNGARADRAINKGSLVLGWVSAFGLTMVANFQTVEMRPGHYTGAGLAFLLGTVYCWLQTSLSVRHCRWSHVAVTQLLNSLLLSACLLICILRQALYPPSHLAIFFDVFDTLRSVYLVSTISEWMTAASIVTFVLTFYRDFSRIELKSPTVKINDRTVVLKDYRYSCTCVSSSAASLPVVAQDGHASGL